MAECPNCEGSGYVDDTEFHATHPCGICNGSGDLDEGELTEYRKEYG